MKNQTTIMVKDAGVNKTFVIYKLKAMASFDLFMDILSVIQKSTGTYAPFAQQFLHNCMQTGTKVEGVTTAEFEKTLAQHSDAMLFFIFNSFFKELDFQTRNNILEQIFKNVIFKNGEFDTKLTILPNNQNVEHVDNYIEDLTTIFSICQEFMRFNYGHFLPQGGKINSPESQPKD